MDEISAPTSIIPQAVGWGLQPVLSEGRDAMATAGATRSSALLEEPLMQQ